jgi:hypothetical protein
MAIQIFVKTISGKSMAVMVEPYDTVLNLKTQIEEREQYVYVYVSFE